METIIYNGNTAIVEHWHIHEILQTLLSMMQISITFFVVIIKNKRCEFLMFKSLVISRILFAFFFFYIHVHEYKLTSNYIILSVIFIANNSSNAYSTAQVILVILIMKCITDYCWNNLNQYWLCFNSGYKVKFIMKIILNFWNNYFNSSCKVFFIIW